MKRPIPLGWLRSTKGRRRALRRQQTPAEKRVWSRLRNRRLLNCKFRRQHPLDEFVVDFYCEEMRLAIELDGDSHFVGEAQERDRIRQTHIEQHGVTFLRFTNPDVFDNLEGVLEDISRFILERRAENAKPPREQTPHPNPLPEERE